VTNAEQRVDYSILVSNSIIQSTKLNSFSTQYGDIDDLQVKFNTGEASLTHHTGPPNVTINMEIKLSITPYSDD
jgi:hypothetical protein